MLPAPAARDPAPRIRDPDPSGQPTAGMGVAKTPFETIKTRAKGQILDTHARGHQVARKRHQRPAGLGEGGRTLVVFGARNLAIQLCTINL